MTYCVERTNLLARAGREMAERLLPAPFRLWHSDHDTGRQMTIVTEGPNGTWLMVWKGSVWHFSTYEFNDRDDIPGLQPDFAFAKPAIDKYFADVRAEVDTRDAERARAQAARDARYEQDRQAAIAAVRQQIGAAC